MLIRILYPQVYHLPPGINAQALGISATEACEAGLPGWYKPFLTHPLQHMWLPAVALKSKPVLLQSTPAARVASVVKTKLPRPYLWLVINGIIKVLSGS